MDKFAVGVTQELGQEDWGCGFKTTQGHIVRMLQNQTLQPALNLKSEGFLREPCFTVTTLVPSLKSDRESVEGQEIH